MLNKPMHTNRRHALSLGCARTIERLIRCERSFLAAVGDRQRSAHLAVHRDEDSGFQF
jgi:hypothetical protein